MQPLIKAVIVDDELLARQKIRRMLRPYSDITIVGECAGGEEAIRFLNKQTADLIFLDIQMPDIDGFGVLQALETIPSVIFITAHEEHALKAFEVQAIDYLLKPFDRIRFEEALRKTRSALTHGTAELQEKIRNLLRSITGEGAGIQWIAVKETERIFFLRLQEIEWIESHSKAIYYHVGAKSFYARGNLSDIEGSLPRQFVRIHKSAVANLNRVQHLTVLSHGDCRLTMQSGKTLLLTRRYRKQLKLLDKMLF